MLLGLDWRRTCNTALMSLEFFLQYTHDDDKDGNNYDDGDDADDNDGDDADYECYALLK